MVKIQNKPIIWYILKSLKKNGFNHFVLPIGYKGKLIKKYLDKNIFDDFNFDILDTGVDTPIAKRVNKIKNFIKSESFILLNGDAIFDINLKRFLIIILKIKKHIPKKTEVILPYGTLTMSNGLVNQFQRNIVFNAVKTIL